MTVTPNIVDLSNDPGRILSREELESNGVWSAMVDRVIEHDSRPSELRVLLCLSTWLRPNGVDELIDAEAHLVNVTGLAPSTVAMAVRWLQMLGIVERIDGTGQQRHRVRFTPGAPMPDRPPVHEDWPW